MNVSAIMHWISTNPSLDVNLLLGGGGLSLILEKALAHFHISSKKVAFTLLHVFGILTAGASWALSHISAGDAIGVYGVIVIVAGFWHRFVISGIYTKDVEPELNKLANVSITAAGLPPAPAAPANSLAGS